MREEHVIQPCLFCGGDASEPNHRTYCDGRQGFIEAELEPYPESAGWKEPTTSKASAAMVDASHLRAVVRECLARHGAMTADECARLLQLSILTIRPRFSELRAMDEISDTGIRHFNTSGKRAIVWRRNL